MSEAFWLTAVILLTAVCLFLKLKGLIMAAADDLKADFAVLKSIAAKAIAQLIDAERQLAAAVAANDPTPLAQLHADVTATNADLAEQLAAASPAVQPVAPAPVADPAPAPAAPETPPAA